MPDDNQINETVLRGLPSKQDKTAPPVILAPDLPAMEKTGAVKTVWRDPLLPLMGAGGSRPTGGEGLMAAVPAVPVKVLGSTAVRLFDAPKIVARSVDTVLKVKMATEPGTKLLPASVSVGLDPVFVDGGLTEIKTGDALIVSVT